MKTFHCSACGALVFFENTRCLTCGHSLAYIPARAQMVARSVDDEARWQPLDGDIVENSSFKLCSNFAAYQICNWALDIDDPESLCRSCRLTHTYPNLDSQNSRDAWVKMEIAKRRLVYGLIDLNLPFRNKGEDAQNGLEFRFLSDSVGDNGDRSRVLTGHDNGLITINVAEADDVYRETQRQQHREPYRTLLGHFRHEIGHFYWDRLVANSDALDEYRRLFGDERADYQAALAKHYSEGAPANWADNFISSYATSHPWEDWAESWAHVMHMVDALETAHFVGLSIRPPRPDEPSLPATERPPRATARDFDYLFAEWTSLTYVLNNLTRGLGLADAYPFVLSTPIAEKLRFVCKTIERASQPGSLSE